MAQKEKEKKVEDAEEAGGEAESKVERAEAAESKMKDLKTAQTALVNEAHQTAAMPEGADKDAKKSQPLWCCVGES